jgi:hypothetical protein
MERLQEELHDRGKTRRVIEMDNMSAAECPHLCVRAAGGHLR